MIANNLSKQQRSDLQLTTFNKLKSWYLFCKKERKWWLI